MLTATAVLTLALGIGALEAQLQGELRQWLASHRADMSPQDQSLWEKQTLHRRSRLLMTIAAP